jgi:hypothetical protein
MLNYRVQRNLRGILARPRALKKNFADDLKNASLIAVKEYKKEIPVDKGTARRMTTAKRVGLLKYVIRSNATEGGISYPALIHEGTYDYRGSNVDIGRINRVRSGWIKSGSKKGIKPNKFRDRAYETAKPDIQKYLYKKINEIIQ